MIIIDELNNYCSIHNYDADLLICPCNKLYVSMQYYTILRIVTFIAFLCVVMLNFLHGCNAHF